MILYRSSTDESFVEARAEAASYCLAMFFDREPSDENSESNGFDGGLLAQLAAGGLFDMTNSGLVAEGDSGADSAARQWSVGCSAFVNKSASR